jgi:hypothetical protein
MRRSSLLWLLIFVAGIAGSCNNDSAKAAIGNVTDTVNPGKSDTPVSVTSPLPGGLTLDTAFYNKMLYANANGDSSGRWPVKGPYPLPGAVFPFKRVVAYYGNLYSKQMGILGELPEQQMLDRLMSEVKSWQKADSSVEVIPALHYIAITAQQAPGAAGKYRLRMPFKEIDKVLKMAEKINALVFLDIQVGHSTLQAEMPEFEKYLKMPHVHFGIDPEFSMKSGHAPGKVVGTFDAADINYATEYLSKIVKENNLPPKILVVHRFTRNGVTNYKQIKLRPEVQIVMDMDGWGHQARKLNTYRQFIYPEPVQFTGFKIFYKNDLREKNSHIMSPAEVLQLKPHPIYIQYQ